MFPEELLKQLCSGHLATTQDEALQTRQLCSYAAVYFAGGIYERLIVYTPLKCEYVCGLLNISTMSLFAINPRFHDFTQETNCCTSHIAALRVHHKATTYRN